VPPSPPKPPEDHSDTARRPIARKTHPPAPAATGPSRSTVIHLTIAAAFIALVLLWSAEVRDPLAIVSGLCLVVVLGVIASFARSCRRRDRPGVLFLGLVGIPAAWALSLTASLATGPPPDHLTAAIDAALLLACPIGYWLFFTLALRPSVVLTPSPRRATADIQWYDLDTRGDTTRPPSAQAGSSSAAISRSKSLAPSNSLYTEAKRR
jgi:hypothetical protein